MRVLLDGILLEVMSESMAMNGALEPGMAFCLVAALFGTRSVSVNVP